MATLMDLSVTVPVALLKYIEPRPRFEIVEDGMLMEPPLPFARPVPSPMTLNVPLVLTRLMPTGVLLLLPLTLIDLKVRLSGVAVVAPFASMAAEQLPL